MKIFLTFDVEIWCGAWNDLDARFPYSYKRYVYGESAHGKYGLPKILEILARHGLLGVFFVEPLFSARFGAQYLSTIIAMIRDAGHEVQLHLHPEWTDEITPPLIADSATKRQHLSYYTKEEQCSLIQAGLGLLRDAGADSVSAFRAGSFAANRDTLYALGTNGIVIDSSLNRSMDISYPDLGAERCIPEPFCSENVRIYPMTVFVDGLGKLRHAQVGACSAAEMRDGLLSAKTIGYDSFVILSHNFEMLKPQSCQPDFFVVKRFEKLCEHLEKNGDKYEVAGFNAVSDVPDAKADARRLPDITVKKISTIERVFEQGLRRVTDIVDAQGRNRR